MANGIWRISRDNIKLDAANGNYKFITPWMFCDGEGNVITPKRIIIDVGTYAGIVDGDAGNVHILSPLAVELGATQTNYETGEIVFTASAGNINYTITLQTDSETPNGYFKTVSFESAGASE